MTTEEGELIMVRGMIAGLGSADQATVRTAAERIRALVQQAPVAMLALALVALEAQVDPVSFGLPK